MNEAVVFLRAHQAQLPAVTQGKLEELSRLPARPKGLLSVSEETQYLESAQSAHDLVKELAGAPEAN